MTVRHFLTLLDLTPTELRALIDRAISFKKIDCFQPSQATNHKTLGLIFEKASTRTRVAFEVAMAQLGGQSIFLSSSDSQLGRGEPIEDTARVLSRMVDVVAIRTFSHETLTRFSQAATIPTINALSDDYHPCQLLADVQTFFEKRGDIKGKQVVWIGDGNNMCHSYINAAKQFDFSLRIASPDNYQPNQSLVEKNKSHVELINNPKSAVKDAHLIVTDVWASMGQESEQQQRMTEFSAFQVTRELLDLADPDVLFMHCLPAHRGEEVTHEVMDDPRSVVWDEAENRLHAQKALLEFLLNEVS